MISSHKIVLICCGLISTNNFAMLSLAKTVGLKKIPSLNCCTAATQKQNKKENPYPKKNIAIIGINLAAMGTGLYTLTKGYDIELVPFIAQTIAILTVANQYNENNVEKKFKIFLKYADHQKIEETINSINENQKKLTLIRKDITQLSSHDVPLKMLLASYLNTLRTTLHEKEKYLLSETEPFLSAIQSPGIKQPFLSPVQSSTTDTETMIDIINNEKKQLKIFNRQEKIQTGNMIINGSVGICYAIMGSLIPIISTCPFSIIDPSDMHFLFSGIAALVSARTSYKKLNTLPDASIKPLMTTLEAYHNRFDSNYSRE